MGRSEVWVGGTSPRRQVLLHEVRASSGNEAAASGSLSQPFCRSELDEEGQLVAAMELKDAKARLLAKWLAERPPAQSVKQDMNAQI